MTTSCTQCGARLHGQPASLRCASCRGLARELSAFSTMTPAARTSQPQDEGSGLIDIRAMGSVLASRPRPASVPVFAGLSPAVTAAPQPRPVTRPHSIAPGSPLPLYGIAVALMLALASLAAHVVTRAPPPTPTPTPEVRVELPAVLVAAAPESEPEPEPEPAAEPEPEPAPEAPAPMSRRRVAKPASERPVKPAPVAELAPKPTPAEPDDSVDCLLGRKQCGRPRSEPAPTPTPAPAPSSDLPAMLEQSDISALTSAGRAAASDACGNLARGGERVKIKLSIAGPTGSILSASTVDDAGNPQLAACAVQQVGKLSVRKVQKPQIGAVLTLKF